MDTNKAIKLLDQAIVLHERHMNGKEATNMESQQKLMNLIMDARAALKGVM